MKFWYYINTAFHSDNYYSYDSVYLLLLLKASAQVLPVLLSSSNKEWSGIFPEIKLGFTNPAELGYTDDSRNKQYG